MTLCLMLLVMGSALYLEPVEGAMKDFAAGFSTVPRRRDPSMTRLEEPC